MIKSVSLGSLRSYHKPCTVKFAYPKEDSIGLTLLVGRNNSGKSTILNVLSDVLNDDENVVFDKLDRHSDRDPLVEIVYNLKGIEQTIYFEKQASAYFQKKSILKNGPEVPFSSLTNQPEPLVAYVPSRRPWDDTFQQHNYDIKSFEKMRSQSMGRASGVRQLERLGDQLNGIISRGEKPAFDTLLRKIMPDFSDWTTDRVSGSDRIMYRSVSGVEHAVKDVGDGVSSIFRLCYALHSYPVSVPLILDEPELSLHPDGQKLLYQLLREHAQNRQIIVATHSPHFIHWPDLVAGARLVRVFQGHDGQTQVSSPSPNTLKNIFNIAHKDFKNRKLFDYSAKEIFFSAGALFLEGQEDVHILSDFIEKENETPLPIFSYGAGGASLIPFWLELASELGLTAGAFFDRDDAELSEKMKEKYRDNEHFLVITSDFHDIRDKPDKKKKGYFDSSWRIKPEVRGLLLEVLRQFSDHFHAVRTNKGNSMTPSANVLTLARTNPK